MRTGRRLLNWIAIRTWQVLAAWSRIELDPQLLTSRERWSVVRAVVLAVFKSRYIEPARRWLLAQTPAWIVAWRLNRRVHRWYRVPSKSAAEHVRLRFDIWPVEVGDHIRLQGGRLTAMAYSTATFSEIIFVLPNGEVEPDPKNREMAKAWARYSARR